MIRNRTTLGLTAILTLTLAVGSARAQTGDPPKSDDSRSDLEQFRSDTIRSFQAAKKDINALREEVARLRKDMDELRNARRAAAGVQGEPPAGPVPEARKEIDALNEQVAQLQKTLDSLRDARSAQSRASNYPPGNNAASGTGSVVLLNTYPAEMTIVVDGETYTLAPGERRVLAGRTPGAFTYEVVGVQPAVQRTLAANGTFPIHIHP